MNSGNRNIIFHVTKKYMKLNRRRTAVAFIGIVFMVLLMTCVFAGKRTVFAYLDKVGSLNKGSWHIIAHDLTPEQAGQIADLEETERIGLSAQLSNIEFPQSANPERPYIDVKAYSPESFDMLNITLTEGRFPANENELIISESAVKDGSSVRLGDRISGEFFDRTITGIIEGGTSVFPFFGIELHFGETVHVPVSFMPYSENDSYREGKAPNGLKGDFTVVGIMHSPSFEGSGASYSALCGLTEGGVYYDKVNVLIRLNTERIDDTAEFYSKLGEMVSGSDKIETNELLLTLGSLSNDSSIQKIVIFIQIFFTVFIMAASVILIYNVFNMSFAERTKYLGMLSSVGATRRQKRQSIFYECFSLLLPALPVGLLAGVGTVLGGMQLLKPRLDTLLSAVKVGIPTDIPVTLSVNLRDVCVIIGLCIVTVLISALIPAIKISRIGPVESIRSGGEKTKKKRFGTKLSLLEKGKPEMLLAVSGTTRSKHLTRSIIRSICVFAVLTVVTLFGAQSIIKIAETKTQSSGWNTEFEDYDYIVTVEWDTESYRNTKDILAQESSVTDVKEISSMWHDLSLDRSVMSEEYFAAYKEIYLQYSDNTEAGWDEYYEKYLDNTFFTAIIVDDEEFAVLASTGDADMSIANDPSVPAVLIDNDMFFSTDNYLIGSNCKGYKYIGVHKTTNAVKGGSLNVLSYSSEKQDLVGTELTVAGFVNDETLKGRFKMIADSPYVFMNRSAFDKLSPEAKHYTSSAFLFAADRERSRSFISSLSEMCEKNEENDMYLADYRTRGTAKNINQVITEMIRILAYCFTGLISMICLLNLYNSIKGRAAERTKETATLRSIGMTDRQLTKMHDLENIMLFGRGMLGAAVICTVLILILRHFIISFFGTVSLPVPMLLSVFTAVFIFAASMIITRLCSRSGDADIIENIRRETV